MGFGRPRGPGTHLQKVGGFACNNFPGPRGVRAALCCTLRVASDLRLEPKSAPGTRCSGLDVPLKLRSYHHHHQWTTQPYFADQLQINSSESGNQLKNTVSLNPSETTVVATLEELATSMFKPPAPVTLSKIGSRAVSTSSHSMVTGAYRNGIILSWFKSPLRGLKRTVRD